VNLIEFYDFKKAGAYRVRGDYTWEKWKLEGTGYALEWRKHILSNSVAFTLSGRGLDWRVIGSIAITLAIISGGLATIIGLRRRH
jgi:hypothetical protein